jgi:hypothetical protein
MKKMRSRENINSFGLVQNFLLLPTFVARRCIDNDEERKQKAEEEREESITAGQPGTHR